MHGHLPYIQFNTSYSLLFQLFLLPFVYIWPAVDSIILMMVLIESATVLIYLLSLKRKYDFNKWYVAFLYLINPISIYWEITGYNGVIISFFILLAVIAAEGHKKILAGILMSVGFLVSKFLILLGLPAIIFYQRKGTLKRLIPLIIIFIILLIVSVILRIDILFPLKYEIGRNTSGNLWFLIVAIIPGIKSSIFWDILPITIFIIIYIPLLIKYIRTNQKYTEYSFDITLAFISISFLLFMIVSKKTYPFYMQMFLLFLIHTVSRSSQYSLTAIIMIFFIGAVTTIEPYLFEMLNYPIHPMYNNISYFILPILDLILIINYLYLLKVAVNLFLVKISKNRDSELSDLSL